MTPAPVGAASPRLSVLDLATVAEGASSGDALRATTELARTADDLGYTRFWVAEHHGTPAVASTSPPVLLAHLAASTRRINLGSGGVMLPNHAPLVVAEQFAMLEALHPGRIDLGIGRAPGTDQMTAAALRRSANALGAEDFPRHLVDLMSLLGDPREGVLSGPGSEDPLLGSRFTATPFPTSHPSVWLLGSSGYSAQVAAALGLPFVFAHHFSGRGTDEAVGLYRDTFRPSPALAAPYVALGVSVLAAPTRAEAEHLAGPSKIARLGLRTGKFGPVVTPDEAERRLAAMSAEELEIVGTAGGTQVVGTAAEVADQLRALAARTEADELILTALVHDIGTMQRTLRLVADEMLTEQAATA